MPWYTPTWILNKTIKSYIGMCNITLMMYIKLCNTGYMFMSVESVCGILNSAMLVMFMSVESVKHKVY